MRRVAAAVAVAIVLGGCGSSSLSTAQLRSRAARICSSARRRTNRIPTPTDPAETAAYLNRGITALRPELLALRRLKVAGDDADRYRTALQALTTELAALRSTAKRLQAGDDPVVSVRALQEALTPSEQRAGAAWSALDIPSCLEP